MPSAPTEGKVSYNSQASHSQLLQIGQPIEQAHAYFCQLAITQIPDVDTRHQCRAIMSALPTCATQDTHRTSRPVSPSNSPTLTPSSWLPWKYLMRSSSVSALTSTTRGTAYSQILKAGQPLKQPNAQSSQFVVAQEPVAHSSVRFAPLTKQL
jgi:hypothetical protein